MKQHNIYKLIKWLDRYGILVFLAIIGIIGFLWLTNSFKIAHSEPLAPHEGDFALEGDTALIGAYNANNEALERWLDKLITYENCPIDGIVDTNGYKSYGPFCYQRATYLDFMSKYGQICMPYAEEGEWLNNLSDHHTQRCLTKNVILVDKNAYKHWFTSTVIREGLGLPPI